MLTEGIKIFTQISSSQDYHQCSFYRKNEKKEEQRSLENSVVQYHAELELYV